MAVNYLLISVTAITQIQVVSAEQFAQIIRFWKEYLDNVEEQFSLIIGIDSTALQGLLVLGFDFIENRSIAGICNKSTIN